MSEMFMAVLPVYVVTVRSDDGPDQTFRVSSGELDAFLRVLTFNDREFGVRKERGIGSPDPAV